MLNLLEFRTSDVLANRPAPGTGRRLFKATDTGETFFDNGSEWIPVSLDADAITALIAVVSVTQFNHIVTLDDEVVCLDGDVVWN